MQNFKMSSLAQSIENKEQFNVYNTSFEGFDILTFKHCDSEELFFIGKQCADMLEYSNAPDAINTHVSDEDKCKLDYVYCTKLMDLISNEINELVRQSDSLCLTENEAKSLISNELISNENNELGSPENLNQIREDDSNSLKNKEIYKFNPKSTTFISEEGLYDLIFDSKKPEAKAFRKTVHKILKEIRTTGGYNLDKAPAINNTQLDNISKYIETTSKYMETNSDSMTVMTQLLDSNLTMDNRIQNITNPMIHAKIGSYTEALFLNPHSAVVANKVSTPTKNWSNNTTCWTAIVNLGVYAHTQRVKNADDRKALYNRMDNFETDTNLLVKTSQVAIAAKFNKIVTDLKTIHNKDIAELIKANNDLKSEHNADINNLNSEIEKLNSANKQLNTDFKTVVLPNFDSLSEKINTLEEAISILKLSK